MLRMDIIEEGIELARLKRNGANLHESSEAAEVLKNIDRLFRKYNEGQICETCKQRTWSSPKGPLCDICTAKAHGKINRQGGFSMLYLMEGHC